MVTLAALEPGAGVVVVAGCGQEAVEGAPVVLLHGWPDGTTICS